MPRPTLLVALLAVLAMLGTAQAVRKPMPRKVAIVRTADRPLHLIAKGKASARVLLDRESSGQGELALTVLEMAPGCEVPEHSHADATEVLYIESGRGLLSYGSSEREVAAGDVLYLPPGSRHSFKVLSRIETVKAVQVYLPGGSEQRFRQGEQIPD